jgi:hypothetical protein
MGTFMALFSGKKMRLKGSMDSRVQRSLTFSPNPPMAAWVCIWFLWSNFSWGPTILVVDRACVFIFLLISQ